MRVASYELRVTSCESVFKKMKLLVASWICKLRVASCPFKTIKLRVVNCLFYFNKQNGRVTNQKCDLKNKVRVTEIKMRVENKSTRKWPYNLKFDRNILCMTIIWKCKNFPKAKPIDDVIGKVGYKTALPESVGSWAGIFLVRPWIDFM